MDTRRANRAGGNEQALGKRFFFEKKNQKTFGIESRLEP
jgi:hypothetical protein